MRRITFLLVAIASVLIATAGSALAASARSAANPPVNNSLPTIAGTAREGQTLTASSGSWGGATPISYAYQWRRCDASGSSCGSIGSAKNQNYVASHNDVGNTIRIQVTATNADSRSTARAPRGRSGAQLSCYLPREVLSRFFALRLTIGVA